MRCCSRSAYQIPLAVSSASIGVWTTRRLTSSVCIEPSWRVVLAAIATKRRSPMAISFRRGGWLPLLVSRELQPTEFAARHSPSLYCHSVPRSVVANVTFASDARENTVSFASSARPDELSSAIVPPDGIEALVLITNTPGKRPATGTRAGGGTPPNTASPTKRTRRAPRTPQSGTVSFTLSLSR
jgi:hypothetical protein